MISIVFIEWKNLDSELHYFIIFTWDGRLKNDECVIQRKQFTMYFTSKKPFVHYFPDINH